jgi:ribonuclease HI
MTGNASAYVTEVCTAMYALEKAVEMQWRDVWIETDSLMVVKAFSNHLDVPRTLTVRWLNCLALAQSFSCTFSDIHREGNTVADALAKNGHSLSNLYSQ